MKLEFETISETNLKGKDFLVFWVLSEYALIMMFEIFYVATVGHPQKPSGHDEQDMQI